MNPTTFVEYLDYAVRIAPGGIVAGGLVLVALWRVTRVWGPCEEHPDGWAEVEEIELE